MQIDVGTFIVCNHTCAGNAPPSGLNVGLNVGIWVNLAALHLECPNVLQSPARRTSVKRRAASLLCTCMSSVLICTIVASASSCRLCAAIVQLAGCCMSTVLSCALVGSAGTCHIPHPLARRVQPWLEALTSVSPVQNPCL